MLSLTSLLVSREAAFRLRGFVNNQSSLATSKQIERRPLNYATIDRRSQGYDNGQLGSARVKLGQQGIGENGF